MTTTEVTNAIVGQFGLGTKYTLYNTVEKEGSKTSIGDYCSWKVIDKYFMKVLAIVYVTEVFVVGKVFSTTDSVLDKETEMYSIYETNDIRIIDVACTTKEQFIFLGDGSIIVNFFFR